MGYVTVKIPKQLAMEIDQLIEKAKNLGYISRAEVVKDAVRRLLDQEKGESFLLIDENGKPFLKKP